MAVKGVKPREERQFDQTFLSEKQHGRQVHRDYAAHYFRWGFSKEQCCGKRVLDVGCGPEWPLGRLLIFHGGFARKRPAKYVGVDLNKIEGNHNRNKIADLLSEFNFVERWKELLETYGAFDTVCNFEVLEHMDEPDQHRLLKCMRRCVKPGGTLIISTPVRAASGYQARNHIREVTIPEMRELLEDAGWEVVKRYGTYGDITKLRKAALEEGLAHDEGDSTRMDGNAHRQTMQDLSEYYCSDVLANFLAPLYPDACKNNLWVCRRPD